MMLHKEDLKPFCVFINLFKTRVNLLEIKKRNEIMMQKKHIYFFLLKGDKEKAHANICLMLRNERICQVCRKLINLCNESNSPLFLELRKDHKDEVKKCIRNILYCSNKLNISNTENIRTNFIKHFGKKFIQVIETDFLLLDKNICSLINKFSFCYNEIKDVENSFLYEMKIPINNEKDLCLCKFCNNSKNSNAPYNFKLNDILETVNTYAQYAETVHDMNKKEIFKKIEKQVILKLNKSLLKN
ncbi:hypothetical protein MKS88_003017 [Plasmodium brasilianum]|uniref:Uncharacterized protein n=2 Tax=Plasmodium (Plasmodium) TaxID=418103 RepID=A0A1A8WU53_PLAMA|nr:conserved Plasmodium protein, unknown function [Plasmodium malariae]KAI4838534.1 hypothetical protein MKS88_003017 [Plasmodium brasilianum]SBS96494.1 conserved Plasmodium protein, unknown function [Plasmodium malariae]SCN12937.1 conserved Plasmodium protein, unknown function [Plasmodium malariae]